MAACVYYVVAIATYDGCVVLSVVAATVAVINTNDVVAFWCGCCCCHLSTGCCCCCCLVCWLAPLANVHSFVVLGPSSILLLLILKI